MASFSLSLASSSRLTFSLPKNPPSVPALPLSSKRSLVSSGSSSFAFRVLNLMIHKSGKSSLVSRGSGGSIVCEAKGTDCDVPILTDATWQSTILKAICPVLVEFCAPWCGPCRKNSPIIAEASMKYAGRIKCFKLNTDESPSTAIKYGIRSIPTIMIFINGKKKEAVIGTVTKKMLTTTIEKFL